VTDKNKVAERLMEADVEAFANSIMSYAAPDKQQQFEHGADMAAVWVKDGLEAQALLDRTPIKSIHFLHGFAWYFAMWNYTGNKKKSSKKAGINSGKSRAENANKSKVVEAWHAWQNHPTKQPYGDKRGCERAFEEAMIKQYDVSPISAKRWRIDLQKANNLGHEPRA
jgi:hypothetical protein